MQLLANQAELCREAIFMATDLYDTSPAVMVFQDELDYVALIFGGGSREAAQLGGGRSHLLEVLIEHHHRRSPFNERAL